MSEPKQGLGRLAGTAVRLAALWLVTGALFKLFAGSPKMIPELVLKYSPVSWTLTYQIAIAIELAIVVVAVLKPHRGWLLITALFGFFLILLVDMILKGKESCGCMGDSVKIPPQLMFGIDAAVLGFVLATKPWRNLAPPGLSTPIAVVGVLVALALPWIVVRPVEPVLPPVANGSTSGTPPTPQNSRPVYIELRPERWTGQVIYDIAEFTRLVPAEKIPSDGRIVLWRQSCDHCAAHLRELVKETTTPILLVQVMDDLKSAPVVDAKPTGPHVTEVQLPPGEGLFTTPIEVRVEGGLVKAVLDRDAVEKEHAK